MLWRRVSGGQSGSLLFSKNSFYFAAFTSFRFLLSAFVVAVGLDNEFKLLPFLVAAGSVLFSLAVFNFIPHVVVLLFLSCGLAVTEWRFAFQKTVF